MAVALVAVNMENSLRARGISCFKVGERGGRRVGIPGKLLRLKCRKCNCHKLTTGAAEQGMGEDAPFASVDRSPGFVVGGGIGVRFKK